MHHTFLFEPGIWTLDGTFWSADGRSMAVVGKTEITHGPECWLLAGRMRILAAPPVDFVNVYRIEVPGRDQRAYKWSSDDSTLGKLHGVFSVVGTAILSLYRSEQGGYQGSEHLRQMAAEEYEGFGVLLMEDRRLSSWHVTLRRGVRASAHHEPIGAHHESSGGHDESSGHHQT